MYAYYHGYPTSRIVAYCKIWYYLLQATSMMFRWMLAAACLDRYVLSSTNAHLRRFASVHIARRVVVAIVLIWIMFPVHRLIIYGLRAGSCAIVYGYVGALYDGIFTIINACGIPIPIMVICSLLIRRNLTKKRERRNFNADQQRRTSNNEHLQRKRDQQALIMLFVQIFVYVILTLPWMIYMIYDAISLNILNKSADRLAIEGFMRFLTATVIFLFPTASFYLYTLTSSMFRKELLNMLGPILCFKCSNNNRRIEPITNTNAQRRLTIQRPTI